MADIMFVTAIIGGGKTLYATSTILKELERSDRFIVTNVPLRLDRTGDNPNEMTVQEWCQKHVAKPIDVRKRIRVLTADETRQFWRYFPDGELMPEVSTRRPDGSEVSTPDFKWRFERMEDGRFPFGTYFVIDEVHLLFGARDWQKIGSSVEFYMSQLRKFNDDLMLISQHPEKVDKNFRRNATQWLYLRNFGRQRLWGGVTLKGRFKYCIYSDIFQRGDSPDMSGWFHLRDRDYEKCYDTMAGVGLMGKLNPEQTMFKGRGVWVWVAFVCFALLLGYFVPRIVLRGAGMAIGAGLHSVEKGVHGRVAPPGGLAPVPRGSAQAAGGGVGMAHLVGTLPEPVQPEVNRAVTITGMVHNGDVWVVGFSDGRIVTSDDVRLTRLTKEGCVYNGEVYLLDRLRRDTNAVPAKVVESHGVVGVVEGPSTARIRWTGNLAPN